MIIRPGRPAKPASSSTPPLHLPPATPPAPLRRCAGTGCHCGNVHVPARPSTCRRTGVPRQADGRHRDGAGGLGDLVLHPTSGRRDVGVPLQPCEGRRGSEVRSSKDDLFDLISNPNRNLFSIYFGWAAHPNSCCVFPFEDVARPHICFTQFLLVGSMGQRHQVDLQ